MTQSDSQTAPTPDGPGRIGNIVAWILSGLLALAMLGGAYGKLTGAMGTMFVEHLQLPLWLMYVTGVVELLGALMLLVPRAQWFGALWIGGTMTGALLSHLRLGQLGEIAAALVLGLFALVIAVLRRDRIAAALGRGAPGKQ